MISYNIDITKHAKYLHFRANLQFPIFLQLIKVFKQICTKEMGNIEDLIPNSVNLICDNNVQHS